MAFPLRNIALITAALLGRSAYQKPIGEVGTPYNDLDSPAVVRMREAMGGQIQPAVSSQVRWYLADLEHAEYVADGGVMSNAARLMRAARRDGVLAGVMSTRTDGLVRLPKKFIGDPDVIEALELGHDRARSVFDDIFPPSELAQLAADGIGLGVGVGELVPVEGRDYPVFVRLDPEFLVYRWADNTWYFRSIAGLLPITPGDGRWILHTPGGRMQPWLGGLWRCIARAFIRKEHAALYKDAWESKLAHPARVAVAPGGAAEAQAESWFRAVMAWGINSVFGMRPGYDVKLLESNGRGWESFNKTIEDQNNEFVLAVCGQSVTVDGGAGFQNSDVHKSIRADLIKGTADALAHTINTQGIPAFIAIRFGEDAIESKATVLEWDVTPPKDRNSEATSIVTTANAIQLMGDALRANGHALDVLALCRRFAIPLAGDRDGDGVEDVTGKPGLRLIQGGKGADDGELAPAAGGTTTSDKEAQDTALNGAQVASLLEIVQQVVVGTVPRDAAIGIIKRAYLVDDAGAEAMLGSAGAGFVPAAPITSGAAA